MTQPARDAALQRYHENFDSQSYNAITEFLVANLYTERDDPRVIDGMVAFQDACFEVCATMKQVKMRLVNRQLRGYASFPRHDGVIQPVASQTRVAIYAGVAE